MPRIFISDSTEGGSHGATVRTALLANHPDLTEADVTLQLNASYTLAAVLADMATAYAGGYELFLHCTTIAPSLASQAQVYWNQVQTLKVITPLGDNSHALVTYSPDERGPMVTCGASDGAANETGYGNALWFFDDDNGRGTPASQDLSSFSTGVIAGKLLYIKDQRGRGWWDAIYAAAQTASENGTPTLNNGYGKIDVAAAIAWTGDLPDDPYLEIGNIGTLSGSNADAVATLTPSAVTYATHYYLERNTGGGWELVDVRSAIGSITRTLTEGISTQFRYRAGNQGTLSEYSNTVTLLYDPVMANKRKQIRTAMAAAFEAVTGSSPYNYSWAGKVDVWRSTPVSPDEGRRLVIRDANVRPEQEFAGGAANQWLRSMMVDVTIYTGDAADTRTIADNAIEDIERVIAANKKWSDYAFDTRWEETTEEKDQQELTIISVTIRVRVLFMTSEWAAE